MFLGLQSIDTTPAVPNSSTALVLRSQGERVHKRVCRDQQERLSHMYPPQKHLDSPCLVTFKNAKEKITAVRRLSGQTRQQVSSVTGGVKLPIGCSFPRHCSMWAERLGEARPQAPPACMSCKLDME